MHTTPTTTACLRRCLPLAATFLLGGCAGLSVHPINSPGDDAKRHGFRYYESSPYLLVQTNNEGGVTSKILHLPDETKKRSVQPFAVLASNTTTLEFKNGVLGKSLADVDGTEVPKAIVAALEKAALASIPAANTGEQKGSDDPVTVPAPYLFRIVVRGNSVSLVGGAPVDLPDINF